MLRMLKSKYLCNRLEVNLAEKFRMKILKKLAQLFLKALIVVLVLSCTTFGWLPTASVNLPSNQARHEISSYLSKVVHKLAGEIGTRNYRHYDHLEMAKDFIAQELEKFGYGVSFQTFSVNSQSFSNIIATKGNALEKNPLIIGAHYDSCFNPGADDNGSAVAGMLALAKLLSKDKATDRVVFVAFVNEEPPFFQTETMGSRVFTKSLKEAKTKIQGAIVLEMIGYYSNDWFSQKYLPLLGPFFPNKGNFIGVVGDFQSGKLVGELAKGFKNASRFPLRTIVAPRSIPGINFSDHWSFWQENYPAVMVTDTAYLRNKNYHQQSDLPETLNYEYMAEVILGLKQAISVLLSEKR